MNLSDYVGGILEDIRINGQEAVKKYAKKFDGYAGSLTLEEQEWKTGKEIPEEDQMVITETMERVRRYHQDQVVKGNLTQRDGSLYGLIYRPIRRVGLYVPGGKPLPSSLIMTGVPAVIAGVDEIVLATPPTNGRVNPYILFIAEQLGIDEIYKAGGAQAIGLLAYGAGIEPVDKIFGPGNKYVNEAKRQVFGQVGIDGLAGPSNICIIADDTTDSNLVLADLQAQLEHGEDSNAWLLTTSRNLSRYCSGERINVEEFDNLESCVSRSNEIAPEHLQIMTSEPLELMDKVQNAGAVYLGSYTPTAAADYFLGVNHVLPTGGTAKFGSVLTVNDFLKSISLAYAGKREFLDKSHLGMQFAEIEGMSKHRKSLEVRIDEKTDK